MFYLIAWLYVVLFLFNQTCQCIIAFKPWTIPTLKNENILLLIVFPFISWIGDLPIFNLMNTILLKQHYWIIHISMKICQLLKTSFCFNVMWYNILKTIFGLPVTIDSVFKMEGNVTRFGKLSLRQSLIWQSYYHMLFKRCWLNQLEI